MRVGASGEATEMLIVTWLLSRLGLAALLAVEWIG